MRFKIRFALLLIVVLTSGMSWGKTRVAVSKFTDKAANSRCRVSWFSRNDLGTGMADQLIAELSNTGRYDLQERQNLNQMYNEEHKLVNADPTAAPKKNQFKAAHYSITGAVTSFELCANELGGKVDVGRLVGFKKSGLNIGGKRANAKAVLDLRIINVETGQVVKSVKAEGEASSTSFDVDGNFKGAKMGTTAFDNTPIGEATRAAIKDAVNQIASIIPAQTNDPEHGSAQASSSTDTGGTNSAGTNSAGVSSAGHLDGAVTPGKSNVTSSTICTHRTQTDVYTMCKTLGKTAAGRIKVLYLDNGEQVLLKQTQLVTLGKLKEPALGQTVYLGCEIAGCGYLGKKQMKVCKIIDVADSLVSVVCDRKELSVSADQLLGAVNPRTTASEDK